MDTKSLKGLCNMCTHILGVKNYDLMQRNRKKFFFILLEPLNSGGPVWKWELKDVLLEVRLDAFKIALTFVVKLLSRMSA